MDVFSWLEAEMVTCKVTGSRVDWVIGISHRVLKIIDICQLFVQFKRWSVALIGNLCCVGTLWNLK